MLVVRGVGDEPPTPVNHQVQLVTNWLAPKESIEIVRRWELPIGRRFFFLNFGRKKWSRNDGWKNHSSMLFDSLNLYNLNLNVINCLSLYGFLVRCNCRKLPFPNTVQSSLLGCSLSAEFQMRIGSPYSYHRSVHHQYFFEDRFILWSFSNLLIF